MTKQQMLAKLEELAAAMKALFTAADARAGGNGKGILNAEEKAKNDELAAAYDQVKAELDALEANDQARVRLNDHEAFMSASAGRRSTPAGSGDDGRTGHREPANAPVTMRLGAHHLQFRAGSAEALRASEDYRRAFAAHLLTGAPSAALHTGSDPDGGYLIPMQMAAGIIQALDDDVFMRRLATVLPPLTAGTSIGAVSLDADPADADWTPEVPASDISEDTTMAFGGRELSPHLITKLIKVSQRLLRQSPTPVEALINQRLAYKFGVSEEKAFLTGTGQKEPLGVFTASASGVPTSRDFATASTSALAADDLIGCLYALKGGYQRRATWLFHRDIVKVIRTLKNTATGEWVWQPSLQAGEPDMILGRPFYMSEYAPNTYTTGNYIGIVGDFKTGYWIADSLMMQIQRLGEMFTLKNLVGFKAAKETDGMPVLAEAFSRLQLKSGG